ncbi:MarR family transcriptional regulator [Candidatus Woesearchaeota archaeon]|nr:MarR family transcriptional regulator [Candidatus Woesearchaeota archaeon]
MDNKKLGIVLIILGILAVSAIVFAKIKEDAYLQKIIENNDDSCYLDDGTCLHDERDFTIYYIGGFIAVILIILGVYFISTNKHQELLIEQHKEVSKALKEAKETDTFKAYLAGFNDEEQIVLKALKENEGIQQSTLRYKTGMSKTSLSLLLKKLEEKGIIARESYKKTNKIHLRQKF